MFQWFIRKFIPLRLAKDDLPIMGKSLKHRISKSYKQEQNKYEFHRGNLKLLGDTKLRKEDNFEDYWRELKTKMNEPQERKVIINVPKVTYPNLYLRRGFAFACALTFIALVIVPFDFTKNNASFSADVGGFQNLIFNSIKSNSDRQLDNLLPADLYVEDMQIDLKKNTYELDQVVNCKLESAAF